MILTVSKIIFYVRVKENINPNNLGEKKNDHLGPLIYSPLTTLVQIFAVPLDKGNL